MQDTSESVNWLQELLGLMGYSTSVNSRVVEALPEPIQNNFQNNSQNYWLEINPDSLQESQIQRLIGQDGVVINAIQYLTNTILNAPISTDPNSPETNQQGHSFYTVELNGYRSKYLANLNDLAEQAVQQVRETKTEFALKQLSSADRRYIHQFLEGFPDIATYSQGKEPNRHLIVKLVQN